MPCLHPSEEPPLGWFVPCLAVADLRASLDWYARLDLVRYGGDPDQGWAMLRSRACEIHLFQGHIPRDLLNFRGGDLDALRAAVEARGLEIASTQGENSFIVLDPDGREVFFDSSPSECEAYAEGQELTGPVEGDVHAGDGLDLGNLTWCLACEDLTATKRFYETLGFVPGGGEPERGGAILARADHPPVFGERLVTTSLSLFEGRIPVDTPSFRGGHVAAIAEVLAGRGVDLGDGVVVAEDGGESLLLKDPDDRPVVLHTTPPERLDGR